MNVTRIVSQSVANRLGILLPEKTGRTGRICKGVTVKKVSNASTGKHGTVALQFSLSALLAYEKSVTK